MHGCGKDCCVIEEIVDPSYNKDGFRCRCTRCDLVTEVKASEGGAIIEWAANNLVVQGLLADAVIVVASRKWKGL
jgi:hypothetical protein